MKPDDKVTWTASGHTVTKDARHRVYGKILWIEGDRARVEILSVYSHKIRCWKKLDQLELSDAKRETQRKE